jgi:hypothetical protein
VALIVALWQKFRYVLLRVWREVRLTWSFALSESDSGSATWTVSFCVYPLLPTQMIILLYAAETRSLRAHPVLLSQRVTGALARLDSTMPRLFQQRSLALASSICTFGSIYLNTSFR